MHWCTNHTLTAFIAKTDRLNGFDQYLVSNFFYAKTFLVAPIVPINLATCDVIDLCYDFLGYVQLNHIGICIWCRVILPPSHTSVLPPFLRQFPSKNEVPPVPIHPNKSTQHCIRPVYRPSQQSTHISPITELYVRQVHDQKLPRCCIDNTNEAESMLPQFFSSRH